MVSRTIKAIGCFFLAGIAATYLTCKKPAAEEVKKEEPVVVEQVVEEPVPEVAVEPELKVEPKIEPKVEKRLEPVIMPEPKPKVELEKPKVEPKPEPKIEPKPLEKIVEPLPTTSEVIVGYILMAAPEADMWYKELSPSTQKVGMQTIDGTATEYDKLPKEYKNLIKLGLDDIMAGRSKETVDTARAMFYDAPETEQKAILAEVSRINNKLGDFIKANKKEFREIYSGMQAWYNSLVQKVQKDVDYLVAGLDEIGFTFLRPEVKVAKAPEVVPKVEEEKAPVKVEPVEVPLEEKVRELSETEKAFVSYVLLAAPEAETWYNGLSPKTQAAANTLITEVSSWYDGLPSNYQALVPLALDNVLAGRVGETLNEAEKRFNALPKAEQDAILFEIERINAWGNEFINTHMDEFNEIYAGMQDWYKSLPAEGQDSVDQLIEGFKYAGFMYEPPKVKEVKEAKAAPKVVEKKPEPKPVVEPELPVFTTADAIKGYLVLLEPNIDSLYETLSPKAQEFGYELVDGAAKIFDSLPAPYPEIFQAGLDSMIAGNVKKTIDEGRKMFYAAPAAEQEAILARVNECNKQLNNFINSNTEATTEFYKGLVNWYSNRPDLQKSLDMVVGGLRDLGFDAL